MEPRYKVETNLSVVPRYYSTGAWTNIFPSILYPNCDRCSSFLTWFGGNSLCRLVQILSCSTVGGICFLTWPLSWLSCLLSLFNLWVIYCLPLKIFKLSFSVLWVKLKGLFTELCQVSLPSFLSACLSSKEKVSLRCSWWAQTYDPLLQSPRTLELTHWRWGCNSYFFLNQKSNSQPYTSQAGAVLLSYTPGYNSYSCCQGTWATYA